MAFNLTDIQEIISSLRRRLRLLEIQGNNGIIKTGLATDRPASLVLSTGTTASYYATDTKTLSVWNITNEEWDEVIFS